MSACKIVISCLLVLSLVSGVYGGAVFDNDSGDFMWSNPANWDEDTLPTATAVIGVAHCVLDTPVSLTGIDTRVDTELQVNSGGSLTMLAGHIHPGYNANGLVVINDGGSVKTVTTTIGVQGGVSGELRVEAGGTMTTIAHTFLGSSFGGSGKVQMNGGLYDCGGQFRVGWGAPAGQVNVDGGQIQIAGTPSAGYYLLIGPGSNVDIEGGTILVEGFDYTGFVGLYGDGRLTAYDGAGTVKCNYDGTNTLIWAEIPEPATMLLLGVGGLFTLRRKNR